MFPLLGGTTLQGDTGTGVAAAAHLAEVIVELFDGVQPALHGVAHALGLAGRQTLFVREVLDQGATVAIADREAMHHLHARDAHQPALGGLALVADTAIGIVALGDVATHALGLEDGRALLRCMGLGEHQGRHGQCQGARVLPESSRLQGQTSTVLFLWFASRPGSRCSCHGKYIMCAMPGKILLEQ
ncbi:hypothetical protein D9M70_407880 [compost metagenome]